MDIAVAKAFQILEALVRSDRPRGVTELALELRMSKANVHRLLQTLVELGYVRQPPETSRYEPSLKLWSLGAGVVERADLVGTAAPVVRRLRDEVSESVQLAVRDGDCIVYVDKADSDRPVRATTTIGSRVPIHCVSTGKAILASSERAIAALSFPLGMSTARTVCSREALMAQVKEIRRLGYAVNRGEWRDHVWGIAAAIVDARNEAVAAIGIWGPEERFKGQNMERLAVAVVSAAAEISASLGASQPQEASAITSKARRTR